MQVRGLVFMRKCQQLRYIHVCIISPEADSDGEKFWV
jgi:hypothetical protein